MATTTGQDSKPRGALLDAAEAILLGEGYGAISSRRVAAKAGVNNGLVYYYFEGMDDLLVALARRTATRSIERQKVALASSQPLWGLWDGIYNHEDTALLTEFAALGNHRRAIRSEMARHSRKIRRAQTEAISAALSRGGIDEGEWPPAAIALLLGAISRYLVTEEASGVREGHHEAVTLVERLIRTLEGDRVAGKAR